MRVIQLIGIIASILLIIACNTDEPNRPLFLDCRSICPEYGEEMDITPFDFEWCDIKNATAYHIQVSPKGDFSEIMFDTITSETSKRASIFLEDALDGSIDEFFPFEWGTKYYWRIAPIINGDEQEWGDIYAFETRDIRDDIVGSYEAKKTEMWVWNSFGATSYYDSIYSIHQIEVEKVEDSRGLRVIDESNGDFDLSFTSSAGINYSWTYPQSPATSSRCQFKIDVDSFYISYRTCVSTPCQGFFYSGRK